LRPGSGCREPSPRDHPPRPASTGCERHVALKRPSGPAWFRNSAESPLGLPEIARPRQLADENGFFLAGQRRAPSPADSSPPSPRSRPESSCWNEPASVASSPMRGRTAQEQPEQMEDDAVKDAAITQTSMDAGSLQIQHADLQSRRVPSPAMPMTSRETTPRAMTPRPQIPRPQSRKDEAAAGIVAAAVACQKRLVRGKPEVKTKTAPKTGGVAFEKVEKHSTYLPSGGDSPSGARKTPDIFQTSSKAPRASSGIKKGGSVIKENKGLATQTQNANMALQSQGTKLVTRGSTKLNH